MKKIFALVMAILVMGTFIPVTVNASSGTATKSMKGSYSVTQYSNSFYWRNGGLYGCNYTGSSGTYWFGNNPYFADSIVHTDIIETSSIGGVSIGNSGGEVSVSSGTISNKYTVKNAWQVNVNYDYKVNGVLLYADFYTSARVQFGTSFYSWYSN
jgi:hypothetical protein